MEKILVITVTYNAMNWAEKCLNSLRSSNIPVDVLIIDNGSNDGTQEFIKNSYPEVQLIQSPINLGFGKANNIGLQKVLDENYDFAYLLNQDAWIFPDTLEKLIKAYHSNNGYEVLSPMQMEANEHKLDYNFAINVIGNLQNISPQIISDLYTGRLESIYEVKFVMAAHWLISRKCIEQVGGFSPTFPHYGEDDNYLNRVNYWNFKAGIVPSSIAVHDRENRTATKEKVLYITKYIQVLVAVSNPNKPVNLSKYLKLYLRLFFSKKGDWIGKYLLRLYKERKQINLNFISSLNQCAFLKRSRNESN